MNLFEQLNALTSRQRSAIFASFLGWTLDAFDFFILVFVIKDIAKEFQTNVKMVTFTLFLTLAMRPVGAFLFGIIADRFGRRPTLMADILFYSALEFASGFAPSLTILIILRALYGVAMGGEWGVGASLTMETIPPQNPRLRLRSAAGRLSLRLSSVDHCLLGVISVYRMARDVHGRCFTRPACSLHPQERRRITGVARA
jgi:MFS family permease